MHFNLILIGQPDFFESPPNVCDLLCFHVIPADAANDEELAREYEFLNLRSIWSVLTAT